MTMNKWTVGLAAAGLLGLSSVAQAQVATKLATTSLSGYVSTAYNWIPGDTSISTGYNSFGNSAKTDRFALDVVSLSIGSPVAPAATGWAAGYNVQLWAGPDAGDLATDSTGTDDSDFAIKQAYVAMRAPVGKGVNLKLGVFDSPLGRDNADRSANAHYSHSIAWDLQPTQLTGLSASYQLHENLGVTALLANSRSAEINGGNALESHRKAWGVAATLTAPASAGFLKGATLDAAYLTGATSDTVSTKLANTYFNLTIPTPVKGLTAAVSYDVLSRPDSNDDEVLGVHLKYALTAKASLAARAEFVNEGGGLTFGSGSASNAIDTTVTLTYDLFANVITRLEYRLTNFENPGTDKQNTNAVFANVIYSF